MRRVSWRPIAVGLTVGFLGWVFGLRTLDAALVGLVAFVVALVGVSVGNGAEHEWPQAQVEEAEGSRREISALTWSFVGRDGRVAEPAVRRLRVVAARRLARRGVVLPGGITHRSRDVGPEDEPHLRARELLGDRAWATLTGPGGWLPSLADIDQCLHAIEALAPGGPAPSPPQRRRPRLGSRPR
ncbi:MAG: hypothetical protein JWP95_555 [Actinotalea sp.]|nr:hypothetical protein [Actinotalea sp.]